MWQSVRQLSWQLWLGKSSLETRRLVSFSDLISCIFTATSLNALLSQFVWFRSHSYILLHLKARKKHLFVRYDILHFHICLSDLENISSSIRLIWNSALRNLLCSTARLLHRDHRLHLRQPQVQLSYLNLLFQPWYKDMRIRSNNNENKPWPWYT